MGRAKREALEWLTWQNGAQTPARPQLFDTVEAEAAAALTTLGGYRCLVCGGPLNVANGYACCGYAYCPFCGKGGPGVGLCDHHVLQAHGRQCFVMMYGAFAQAYGSNPSGASLNELLALTPPARRVSSIPWNREQLARAYSPDVLPHLETLFGPNLADFSMTRLGPALLAVLQPDVRTSLRDGSGHWQDFYFCQDVRPALEHLVAFLTQVHEGTGRLQAMTPHEAVCPAV